MIKCPPYISTSLTFTSKKPCKTPSSEEVNHQFYIYFCNPLPKRQRRGVVKAMCKFFVHCSSLVNICIFGIIDHKERTKVWVRKMSSYVLVPRVIMDIFSHVFIICTSNVVIHECEARVNTTLRVQIINTSEKISIITRDTRT